MRIESNYLILCLTFSCLSGCAGEPFGGFQFKGATPRRDPNPTQLQEVSDEDKTTRTVEQKQRAAEVSEGLSVWSDSKFQRQLAESYMSETEIEPRVTSDEREVLQEIFAQIQADQLDQAIARIEATRNDASSAVFDFTQANIYFQREQFTEAARYYRAAVDKHPKFRRAWSNLGKIYVREGDYNRAVDALTRVIELGGGDGITFGLLGFSYSQTEDHLAAESAFRRAILMDAQSMDWKMGLARSLFEQQRFAEAASFLGQLIERHPDRADLWMLQANAYIGLREPLKAAENFEMVRSLGAATVDSLNMLGDIYINEELYDLAVEAYIAAMVKSPDKTPGRAIRAARVLAARGAHEETDSLTAEIERLRGEMLSEDDRKELLKLRARVAIARGATEQQAELLEQIVKLDPLDGEALLLLGRYHEGEGDTQRAIFYYERAASIEEHEADAKVRHAQLLVKNEQYEQALPLLRSAQKIEARENVQQFLEQVERFAKRR